VVQDISNGVSKKLFSGLASRQKDFMGFQLSIIAFPGKSYRKIEKAVFYKSS